MRVQSTMIASILCALFACFAVTEAGKDTIEISEGDVTFTVTHYDDGRFTAFKVSWIDPMEGFLSIFTFNKKGLVTEAKADDTKYNVKNSGSSKKKEVTTTGKFRERNLLVEEGGDAADMVDGNDYIDHQDGERRLYECGDCENAVEILASKGVSSVCNLVNYGEPFDDSAVAAIDTFCDIFGLVSAEEACEDQCDG